MIPSRCMKMHCNCRHETPARDATLRNCSSNRDDRPTRLNGPQSLLTSEPRNIACLINFTWLLAAHEDVAIRRTQGAIELGERAVYLSRGEKTEALALDALAAAYTSAGRFTQALDTAERALALDGDDRRHKAIRERLSLYRRGLPFRVISSPLPWTPRQSEERFLDECRDRRSRLQLDVPLRAEDVWTRG